MLHLWIFLCVIYISLMYACICMHTHTIHAIYTYAAIGIRQIHTYMIDKHTHTHTHTHKHIVHI
jgi:hypothetical protein